MRGLSVALLCAGIPTAGFAVDTATREAIDARIAYYATTYSIPIELLRKVVRTESTYNPAARNGPYWGLMQIRPDTAKGLGYQGSASGLLDAETNLIYAGAYLANAYRIAGGNAARAHALYKNGYYYEAKRKRMLSKLIKVPMGTTPVLVAGKLVTRPSDKTMLALATPEPASPVIAKAAATKLILAEGAKPEVAPEVADVVVASADIAAMPKPIPRPVAKPVVEMAEILVPLLPRAKPAITAQIAATKPAEAPQLVAAIEPIKGPVRGLVYATALVPPSTGARPDFAERTVAQPELALASLSSSRFAKDATAMAFATSSNRPRLQAAHKLPAAVRLASTDDGIRSDAPACCQFASAADDMPLPRARPVHKAN